MLYGYFDDKNREYVITNPKTPVKWINYIGTLDFGGFVDHTGGALICKQDPTLNRITKYLPQLPASEFKGETLYLRIQRGGGYTIFSPFFVPTLHAYDRYECHVGLGYTRFITEAYGLRVEVTIFVPREGNCEVRDIWITNISARSLEVDAIPVVEYTHPNALLQFTNADWVPQTMMSKAVYDDGGLLVLRQYPFMRRDTENNYFTSNLPVSSFESDRARFLGDQEYGSWANPLSLQQPELSNYEAVRGNNIAALMHHVGTIPLGETRRLITQLGQASLEKARPSIEQYRSPQAVDAALSELASFWDEYLSKIQVKTPNPSMNSMLNVHNPRQCYITKIWSRYLSLYQLGLGSRGIGCRDSSQDVMAVLACMPNEAKILIRKLLSIQRCNGSAMHQFNPLTMVGSEGESLELEDRPHYYSDDHLWIVLAVTAYLKETGDFAFLDEDTPYYEKSRAGKPLESGSVLDHLRRAVAFTKQDVGAHGLHLLGYADWNDTVNLAKGAESLFTAHLYGKALLELIELMKILGDTTLAEAYKTDHEKMKGLVNQYAWDGAWYVRYFDFDGTPLGSKTNLNGQIYLNGQSWSILSGFATSDRGKQAMESVKQKLHTPKGIKLSTPGFNGFDPRHGGITTYPPGAKENGGIFLHPNPWAIIAETLLGNGDRAFMYYTQINPATKNEIIDEFECEPYVYPQNILGDEHPLFGSARNSWLSGTASWIYQAATQYILGVRSEYDGLRVDPCIPSNWDAFEVARNFRGARYTIIVKNPKHVCKGVRELKVNGKVLKGSLIPLQERGEVLVEVTLG